MGRTLRQLVGEPATTLASLVFLQEPSPYMPPTGAAPVQRSKDQGLTQ